MTAVPADPRPAAVILAAGAGSRLGELGKRYSKAMLPIAGRPLIDWVVERLQEAGIGRIIVVGHPSDRQLATFLEASHPRIALVLQPQRRGIADALRTALPEVGSERAYLACACDSLFTVEDIKRVIELGTSNQGRAVVGVLEMGVEATPTRSAVRLDGDRVVEIVEKPAPGTSLSGLVAMPLYWLPPEIAPSLDAAIPAEGEGYVSVVLAQFAACGGDVRACRLSGRIEVTSADDVAAASAMLESSHGDGLWRGTSGAA